VSWDGNDRGGAGIAGYDIFVSTDGGPYTAWQALTPSTSATFGGALVHTYSFYSMATDNAGRRQQSAGPVRSTTTLTRGPDLVEAAVSNPPSSVKVGGSFTVTDTARNDGRVLSGKSFTRCYLSPAAGRTASSRLLAGSRAVPVLASGTASSGKTTVSVPSGVAHGSYYLVACADDTGTVIETNSSNRCTASSTTTTVDGPDLVETAVSNPPASVKVGGSFSVTDTTSNTGQAWSGSSVTRYYLSATAAKTTTSHLLTGSRTVPALAAAASSTGKTMATVPSGVAKGSYYLLACANDKDAVAETNTGDNCKASSATSRVE
jgi:hypothetical protein